MRAPSASRRKIVSDTAPPTLSKYTSTPFGQASLSTALMSSRL
jgi:hypothetical protein